ncbi:MULTISPECIES: glycosyltransferase family 4 protein [Streptococcus]|uniref:Glycosyltransferase family 4 protein n=1 Tax=Streptococcus ruminantium TaxID=1917441 RepID=A0ABU1B4C6_9STRE|nr:MULTISPECIES: glycosyltransferase family 4 protein [Streptococcus]MDQ8759750.1 glycosyltransferase family 4 protein [Streptococcus ruminantium]MDQ8766423.1 glycosyltransferase family 4 protein [Streptococcus ruminantium]MDQ8769904.1 glycosyltransferase family 4 protein [Streptococcus ruminantium]MDQ8780305.1 glycosyltransferase family 4 protein [Streptococcus ruminantium]MDQ8794149.1 glycosyltransferase family 4 protein [Streptococcus ruminantium]
MRIGLFTDTYFPQVSGVATSIRTLKTELEKLGHTVFIFTTTDQDVNRYEDWDIIRIPSVPFFAFKDRRIAYAGFKTALKIAGRYKLDMIHTHTEFSLGILGKMIAKELDIPVVHTYHTQYEDYVHYIAKGKIIRPGMVKYLVRAFLSDLDGVICPSEIVETLLTSYNVPISKRVIPTGIDLAKFERPEIGRDEIDDLRTQLGIESDDTMLLSLSRISHEKNIQAIVQAMPRILSENQKVKLVIVGGGPYLGKLQSMIAELDLAEHVQLTGMIAPSDTALYYKAADFFISASTSETQGLTFLESLASGTPILAHTNPYLRNVVTDKMFGTLYVREQELADAVIEAIVATPPMNPYVLDKKLYEISSTNFGRKVFEYYLDLKISYDFRKEHTNQDSVAESLLKEAIHLPQKVVVKSTNTTARMLKKSVEQVKSIRNFFE